MLFLRIHDRVSRCQIRRTAFAFFLLVPLLASAQASTAYQLGLEAYANNRPTEAAAYFETVRESGEANIDVYLYLGQIYEQIGLFDRGLEVLEQAKEKFPSSAPQVYFNQGNIFRSQGNIESSISAYSQAISLRANYAAPYLNRANTLVFQGDLQPAVSDYRLFLQLDPNNALAPQVRQMINAIEAEFAARQAAEVARQAEQRVRELEAQAQAEQAAREAEARVAEAERQAQVAEDRRRELLNSVFNSLGAASSTATGLGAGADSVIEVEEEITIDND